MQQRIKFHWCILQMVKHFQEHDKIKTHKFTFDVHLAHYSFPILKQCKQVTYAFKTTLPLAHPPKSLSSYYLGGKHLQLCRGSCARRLQAAEQGLGLARGERPNNVPFASVHIECLPDCALLGLVLLPEGRGFIKPSWHILGLFPPQVHTSLLSGGHVTGYRVMVIPDYLLYL